jgi:hypothetical protein
MLPLRMFNTMKLRSRRLAIEPKGSRNRTGMTRSLQIIVASATVSTITIPVAADMPPMKTSRDRAAC